MYPLGLSFLGAPLATAISFNLVSLASIFYGYYYTPLTAWSPITRESFNPTTGELWKGWGVLAKLGVSGVFQTASEWWSYELVGCEHFRNVSFRMLTDRVHAVSCRQPVNDCLFCLHRRGLTYLLFC